MGDTSQPFISLRAYAKHRGVSAMSVSTAIKVGRLKECVTHDTFGQPKIRDVELADREWAANTNADNVPIHARHVMADGPSAWDAAVPPPEHEDGEPFDLNGANARAKHWDAELRKLKYEQAAGLLVRASDVEHRMTSVFTECKTKLLAIPSRIKQERPNLTLEDLAAIDVIVREALEGLAGKK